jgi:arsenical pump membrane protein
VGAVVAAAVAPAATGDAAARTWAPFVLVTGLLLIGVVANQDGVFAAAAGALSRLPGGDLALYLAAMLLVAVVTVFLNLDTSVAFLTPVLIHLARRRRANELRFMYGCIFMSNAASLLLPGSNLTNLLVLANEHVSGSVFLTRMLAPWAAAVVVTTAVVAVAFRGSTRHRSAAVGLSTRPGSLGIAGVAVGGALILLLANAALPVLAVGVVLAGIRLGQRRLEVRQVHESIDIRSLLGVFLFALSLGTLARVWSYPAHLMATAGSAASAALGAGSSVLINNLPAAVLLGSRMPAHPRSLLIGLNIGPNLAVTGSLSALIWWQAARSVGAHPSIRRYSAVGILLVPLTVVAALLAGRFGL